MPPSRMASLSNAKVFFDQIFSGGKPPFEFLEEVAAAASMSDENEWRDFKEANSLTQSENSKIPPEIRKDRDEKVKSIWSEYLGAFANSGGGLLIWGISAPDRFAKGVSLVADVDIFEKRLISLVNDAIEPSVTGVVVKAVPRDAMAREGFVVCLIPESQFSPHRSKFAKREYYIRSQDGNVPCSVSILRRLFYPQFQSALQPEVRMSASKADNDYIGLQGSIDIKNLGQYSASEVFITIKSALSVHVNDRFWSQESYTSQYVAKQSIHPGRVVRLAHNLTEGRLYASWPDGRNIVSFEINIYARDATPVRQKFQISWQELKDSFETGKRELLKGTATH